MMRFLSDDITKQRHPVIAGWLFIFTQEQAMTFTDMDIQAARTMAEFYASRGMACLPSRIDAKRPLVRFKQYQEADCPPDLMTKFETPNMQIMLGVSRRLMVIDLDGPESIKWFDSLNYFKPKTWVTHSGGNGQHHWFLLPPNWQRPLRKAVLWAGDGKHSAAERLCDGSLIVAPPSIHVVTGERYRFRSPAESPKKLPYPAIVPRWLLDLPPITPEIAPIVRPTRKFQIPISVDSQGHYRACDVREAIPDKIKLAASWGVNFGSIDKTREWVPCHAFNRDDKVKSAAVSKVTGGYNDKGSGLRLGLFDLAVALGIYTDWRDAVADLGQIYSAQQQGAA
jgi:hypothetical protein